MIPHPAVPRDPTLWSLNKILDQARRWLDHCDTQEDYDEIEAFIMELEIKIDQTSESVDFLSRCLTYGQ